jgi:DNA repair exonuclease SbcCD ATPase subunit
MKKLFFALILASIVFSSCNNKPEEVNTLADSLSHVNEGLKMVVNEKDSSIESFIVAFNEIQENLNEVKAKQKMISTNSSDAELKKNMKEQIIGDIQSINELMDKNKNKIASLKAKLENSNGKVDELEKMITFLTTQLEEKDLEIIDLKNQLERLNIEVTEITAKYEEKNEESNQKTEQLNTAYYAIGTAKELKEKGVLTKEGGFIGLGKTKKLAGDFNKNYFTKVDITQNKSFALNAKKAKLITTHPSSSYKIEGVKTAEKIVILNPQEFWSASKYMVLVLEN